MQDCISICVPSGGNIHEDMINKLYEIHMLYIRDVNNRFISTSIKCLEHDEFWPWRKSVSVFRPAAITRRRRIGFSWWPLWHDGWWWRSGFSEKSGPKIKIPNLEQKRRREETPKMMVVCSGGMVRNRRWPKTLIWSLPFSLQQIGPGPLNFLFKQAYEYF